MITVSAPKSIIARRQARQLDKLLTRLTPYLASTGKTFYQPVWSRRKMGKLLVEFGPTDTSPQSEAPHYIVKVYRSGRGKAGFEAIAQLWHAGFRPPSPFTVVRPVAYIADRQLLLQEKAPGRQLQSILFEEPEAAPAALTNAAGWLATLHGATLTGAPWIEHHIRRQMRYDQELADALPEHAPWVTQLAKRAIDGLELGRHMTLYPSHGDFHADNIFLTAEGQVTVIDLDTFGMQERAADAAYFLAQTAIMGYFHQGSFEATASARQTFSQAYNNRLPGLSEARLALYIGMAFLQSLHYELCVLHTNNQGIISLWLQAAERCLCNGETTITDERSRTV